MQTRDQARRFIVLIDELYNAHVQLVSYSISHLHTLLPGFLSLARHLLIIAADVHTQDGQSWAMHAALAHWASIMFPFENCMLLPGVHGRGGARPAVCGSRE